jgi:predicted O-methyltransferase YrrM
MRSSYIDNNYKDIFNSLIKITQPDVCVELGVLDGFSTVAIGESLKTMGSGHLFSYDLFEDYDYKSQNYTKVLKTINDEKLGEWITLRKKNVFDATYDFKLNTIGFLHVDISNDGQKISKIIEKWNDKIIDGGVLIFEGGSPLRDNIAWMRKYKKDEIYTEIRKNRILQENYTYTIIHQYPSIVICTKNVYYEVGNMSKFGYVT